MVDISDVNNDLAQSFANRTTISTPRNAGNVGQGLNVGPSSESGNKRNIAEISGGSAPAPEQARVRTEAVESGNKRNIAEISDGGVAAPQPKLDERSRMSARGR